jgi:hypothetical protein
MFESDSQNARVCRALCACVGLRELWTPSGPTDDAMALLAAGGGPLSGGERTMLLVAWAVWNGDDNARLGDTIHRLDGRGLVALGRLLVAMANGGSAIDAWITTMESNLRR